MQEPKQKRGYLHDAYRIFHLKDIPREAVPMHYHSFRKLVILLAGSVGYDVEGKRYELNTGDLILVDAGELHRPVLHQESIYERMIIYLSPAFFEKYEGTGRMFERIHETGERLLCADISKRNGYREKGKMGSGHNMGEKEGAEEDFRERLLSLTDSACEGSVNFKLLQVCRLTTFLIELNDQILAKRVSFMEPVSQNRLILQAMEYISSNLKSDLSVENIADQIHINKSYLMHRFKSETGCTLKEYITEKRLFQAEALMANGKTMSEACYGSGFTSYTSFYRAYRKKHGATTKKAKQEHMVE